MFSDPIMTRIAISILLIAIAAIVLRRQHVAARVTREGHADAYVMIYGVEAVEAYVVALRKREVDLDLAADLEAAIARARVES